MRIENENTIGLSVRELVEFVLSEGDIDNRRTGAAVQDAMLIGAAAHRTLQASMGSDYSPEVSLKTTCVWDEQTALMIDGRADGIISDFNGEETVSGTKTVDEIKGMFRDITKLEAPLPVHLAQAEMYAAILSEDEDLKTVHVQVTYVQLREEEDSKAPLVLIDQVRRFVFHYTREEIREKYAYYTGLYEKWARFVLEHRRKRKASVQGFPFPFSYRPGQKKIVSQAYRTMQRGSKLFVQAPTGIGKTLAMLYPAVQAVGQDIADKIFYLTAKTVTSTVAEEGMSLMASRGLEFSFVKLTAKEKVCPQEVMKCDPVHCDRAKGHFSRVNDAVYDMITHETSVSQDKIVEYAAKHMVCPYELSLDVSYYTDVIIGDYNYAFAPHVALQRYFSSGTKGPYIFLADEAHNLPDRARDMYSAVLVKEDVLAAKKLFAGQKRITKLLDRVNKAMLELKRECDKVTVFSEDGFPGELLNQLLSLREAMTRYLDKHNDAPEIEEILDFYFKVGDFLDASDYSSRGYVSYASFGENGIFFLKYFCIDPSYRLQEYLDNVVSTIFFSATFLPVNYYKELLTGNKDEEAIYVDSPFDPDKRALIIGRDVSSKYTRRGPEEYGRIAGHILAMVRGMKGNYLAFFPSHLFLDEVKKQLEIMTGYGDEIEILAQKRTMSEEDRSAFLKAFQAERPKPLLGLCVMGGVFSEGIDLREDRLIGVAVVGTGLPQVCIERELMKDYYADQGENGFDYAYRYPGFNKVMQAAGRLIRTDTDVGVILLLDERFAYRESLRLFPKEWADYKLCDRETMPAEIAHFWRYI